MFRKISALFLGLILLLAVSCEKGGKEEEMAELVGNVFGIQSMSFMMLLYGMPVENAVIEVSEDQTQAVVTYTDYVVADALTAMGASPEDLEGLPLSGMSGTVNVTQEGAMIFDLTLAGSSVTELAFSFDNNTQEVSDLVADGTAYDVNEALQKMAEERMKEQAAAEQAAAAEAPQLQTTVPSGPAAAPVQE